MNTVTLNSEKKSLFTWNETTQLRDESGQTIGYFLPTEEWELEQRYRESQASLTHEDYRRAIEMVSDEELEEARRQTGGRPLAEFLRERGML